MDNLSGAVWRKARRSGGNGGNCVEVTTGRPGVVAVRDSKDPRGPILIISKDDWTAFTAQLRPTV